MLPEVKFSRLALEDLKGISRYTARIWGADQALCYVNELEECVRRISKSPLVGRECSAVKPGLRRVEQGRHVIFYRPHAGRIIVSRVLHQRMLPRKHVIDL